VLEILLARAIVLFSRDIAPARNSGSGSRSLRISTFSCCIFAFRSLAFANRLLTVLSPFDFSETKESTKERSDSSERIPWIREGGIVSESVSESLIVTTLLSKIRFFFNLARK